MLKTLIVPIYKSEQNIPSLLQAISEIDKRHRNDFEAIFVIDGSPDNSYILLNELLPQYDFEAQVITLSRNFGSFSAIQTGMLHARGKYLAVVAADLQEPPELIDQFFETLETNKVDIVFGQRISRQDSLVQAFLANIFWFFYKKLVNPNIPKGGVDIFGCNDVVRNVISQIHEPNSSLIGHLFWAGFRRSFVPYERQERKIGKSSWTLTKRFRYMLDSVFSFSDFPIMLILCFGIIGIFFSVVVGLITLIAYSMGLISVPGYTSVLLLTAFLGSVIITTQGLSGCYLWRTYENTKNRPLTLIQEIKLFSKKTSSI